VQDRVQYASNLKFYFLKYNTVISDLESYQNENEQKEKNGGINIKYGRAQDVP
jgi:hypothetical protein